MTFDVLTFRGKVGGRSEDRYWKFSEANLNRRERRLNVIRRQHCLEIQFVTKKSQAPDNDCQLLPFFFIYVHSPGSFQF